MQNLAGIDSNIYQGVMGSATGIKKPYVDLNQDKGGAYINFFPLIANIGQAADRDGTVQEQEM
jgi:hypothetical protein